MVKRIEFDDLLNVNCKYKCSIITYLCLVRCQASAVAVSVAIAMMLQRKEKHTDKTGQYNIPAIITDSYDIAVKYVETDEQVT